MWKYRKWISQNIMSWTLFIWINSNRHNWGEMYTELNSKSIGNSYRWSSRRTTNSTTLKECLSFSTKDYMKIGCFGYGTFVSDFIHRKIEDKYTNGRVWISPIHISYSQWLSRTKNKGRIGKEGSKYWMETMLIHSTTIKQDNIWKGSL